MSHPATIPYPPILTLTYLFTYSTTVAQIQDTIKCAHDSGVSISARSGGHSYAAYGLSGDIVIDMVNFKNITVNPKNFLARVETGNRLGNVATEIFAQGERALPHGSCPYVRRICLRL